MSSVMDERLLRLAKRGSLEISVSWQQRSFSLTLDDGQGGRFAATAETLTLAVYRLEQMLEPTSTLT